jgi:hypothetical protein
VSFQNRVLKVGFKEFKPFALGKQINTSKSDFDSFATQNWVNQSYHNEVQKIVFFKKTLVQTGL